MIHAHVDNLESIFDEQDTIKDSSFHQSDRDLVSMMQGNEYNNMSFAKKYMHYNDY